MRIKLVKIAFAIALVSSTTYATMFDAVNVEYWAGAGESADNTAMLIVDFVDLGGSYAFGYGWMNGGAHSGFDMLSAVDAGGAFSFTSHHVDGLGNLIDTMSYDGITMGAGGWNTDWMYSYVITNGATWTEPGAGADGILFEDGDYYGWAHQNTGNWPADNQPTIPGAVPEPGTLALFAVGGGACLLRLRKGRNSE